jgi:hypothetical protein
MPATGKIANEPELPSPLSINGVPTVSSSRWSKTPQLSRRHTPGKPAGGFQARRESSGPARGESSIMTLHKICPPAVQLPAARNVTAHDTSPVSIDAPRSRPFNSPSGTHTAE